ncbi:MAG: carboxyvinyl-carboxyphosphonate phosphorylmutase [Rhodospirillaceae bacterium]|nr:carboxyvinyl-carboxyphosphonate phosphorylmutase [Rhodospirillaceae bacterium]|tara:strand:- start:5531 stop:6391 length:861 start_codon:yes stop_codon:yes gene_type:complete
MKRIKDLFQPGKLVTAPGIFDGISARMADPFDFELLYMTGYGTVASHLGMPDAGIASYTDMVGRVQMISNVVSTPFIADGDTGYGGLLNMQYTIKGYELAGAAGIQIEDQEFPKKCGHTPGRKVIPLEDMVQKIQVAVETRESKDFLIVARTDARTSYGLDEALRRGDAFSEAGADILFIESPESVQEMEKICSCFDCPLLVNVVDGGSTPVLAKQAYIDLGYQIAIYPGTGFLAAAHALNSVYGTIKETGSSLDVKVPLRNFMKMAEDMGFKEVWDFDKRHERTG